MSDDSVRINEPMLRRLGVDPASLRALRNIEKNQEGSSMSQSQLEALVRSMVPPKAKNDTDELLTVIALSQSEKINDLQGQIEQLRALIASPEREVNELRAEIEALKAQIPAKHSDADERLANLEATWLIPQ